MNKTNDPMLRGFIETQLDAMLNDPEGISPKEKPLKASVLYKFNSAK